jgi:SP family arabinose:H+ symporter-like MFS transporter
MDGPRFCQIQAIGGVAHMKLNARLIMSTGTAAMGGLTFGFDTAMIAGTIHGLSQRYQLSPTALGATVSCAIWGTVLGGLLSALPGERFGARNCLRFGAALYFIAAIGSATSWSWTSLLVFRFIGGLGIGAITVFGPMYIADISPALWRGRLVRCFQLAIVTGILLAYASNFAVGLLQLGTIEWRWQMAVAVAPALLFFLALFGIPPSPAWLVKRGRIQEARNALQQIREEDCERKLLAIERSLDYERQQKSTKLFTRRHRLPIFLALSVGIFNQFSGINAILYYLNDIFAKAGFDRVSANAQSIAIGAANLLFTVLAMMLIDRIGRRFLLLIGSAGMAASLAGVATIFYTMRHQETLLWCLIGFIAFFAFSQGTVVWVYLSEVFPTSAREKGQSLGTFSLWLVNAIVAGSFPRIAAASGGAPFVLFSTMMAIQFFVVFFIFPETKGLSLEEVPQYM